MCGMGTYHFIGTNKVKVIYKGNTKTCGKCHQEQSRCPGKAIASECSSERTPLDNHMSRLMAKVERMKIQRNTTTSPKGHEVRKEDYIVTEEINSGASGNTNDLGENYRNSMRNSNIVNDKVNF